MKTLLLTALVSLSASAAHAESCGQSDKKVNDVMSRSSKLETIKYESPKLKEEIAQMRREIEACIAEGKDSQDKEDLRIAFTGHLVRLSCRLALETGERGPISCGEYSFDGYVSNSSGSSGN